MEQAGKVQRLDPSLSPLHPELSETSHLLQISAGDTTDPQEEREGRNVSIEKPINTEHGLVLEEKPLVSQHSPGRVIVNIESITDHANEPISREAGAWRPKWFCGGESGSDSSSFSSTSYSPRSLDGHGMPTCWYHSIGAARIDSSSDNLYPSWYFVMK